MNEQLVNFFMKECEKLTKQEKFVNDQKNLYEDHKKKILKDEKEFLDREQTKLNQFKQIKILTQETITELPKAANKFLDTLHPIIIKKTLFYYKTQYESIDPIYVKERSDSNLSCRMYKEFAKSVPTYIGLKLSYYEKATNENGVPNSLSHYCGLILDAPKSKSNH